MSAGLRPPAPPVRVAQLLLPTVLALAGRGPLSAAGFLTVLAGTRVTAHAGDTPVTGVRP